MPVEDGSRLTSPYSLNRKLRGKTNPHWGSDFGGVTPGQSSPAYAVSDGRVRQIGGPELPWRDGPPFIIDHDDGGSTYYGHVRHYAVKVGQRVVRGQKIAESWHEGIPLEWGIHLHLERWTKAGDHTSHVDPTAYLAKHGWVIRDGRLYDEGPRTLTHASHTTTTTKEATLSAAEVKQINAHTTAEVNRLLAAIPGAVMDHTLTLPRGGGETSVGPILASDYMNNKGAFAVVKALTDVVTELAGESAPVTVEEVRGMLQRVEDRAVDAIASGYELTPKGDDGEG